MTTLFAYGTLRRPAWRRAVLGADVPSVVARLPGWRRVGLRSGYLSIREAAGAFVDGVLLLDLDARARRRIEAWEEVPRYVARAVTVLGGGANVAAMVYVCDEEPATLDVPGERDALLDDAAVERAIATFALSAP